MNRILLVLALLLLPSCYCWEAIHVQEPKCVIAHQAVDCTKDTILSLAPSLIPIAMGLINTGSMDWDKLLTFTEGMGFKDAGCFLAALESDFLSKYTASPEHVSRVTMVKEGFLKWKISRQATNVKFILPEKKLHE